MSSRILVLSLAAAAVGGPAVAQCPTVPTGRQVMAVLADYSAAQGRAAAAGGFTTAARHWDYQRAIYQRLHDLTAPEVDGRQAVGFAADMMSHKARGSAHRPHEARVWMALQTVFAHTDAALTADPANWAARVDGWLLREAVVAGAASEQADRAAMEPQAGNPNPSAAELPPHLRAMRESVFGPVERFEQDTFGGQPFDGSMPGVSPETAAILRMTQDLGGAAHAIAHPDRYTQEERDRLLRRTGGWAQATAVQAADNQYWKVRTGMAKDAALRQSHAEYLYGENLLDSRRGGYLPSLGAAPRPGLFGY